MEGLDREGEGLIEQLFLEVTATSCPEQSHHLVYDKDVKTLHTSLLHHRAVKKNDPH